MYSAASSSDLPKKILQRKLDKRHLCNPQFRLRGSYSDGNCDYITARFPISSFQFLEGLLSVDRRVTDLDAEMVRVHTGWYVVWA